MNLTKSNEIAVISGQEDILRIIPKARGTCYEFKISLLNNNFIIKSISCKREEIIPAEDGVELTYHKSRGAHVSNGLIHLKKLKSEDGKRYIDLQQAVDLEINAPFPIPLMKINYVEPIGRKYVKKNNHSIIDLNYVPDMRGNLNTVELFFIPPCCIEDFMDTRTQWPMLSLLWSMTSIDYIVNGVDLREDLTEYFSDINNKPMALVGAQKIGDFLIGYKRYNSHATSNTICIYNNTYYIHMLATTPVKLGTESGRRNTVSSLLYCRPFTAMYFDPFTDIFPAFCYDLDIQFYRGGAIRRVSIYKI